MKPMIQTWIFLTVLATIALLVARFAQPGRFALELDVYILVVGGLALLEVVMATRQAYPRAGRSALAEALDRQPPGPLRPPELERLERELTLGSSTAFDLHYRLRPTLREIADERLAARGLRLDGGGAAVEQALGEELWELVRPDREPPVKRFAPGISPPAAARVVERNRNRALQAGIVVERGTCWILSHSLRALEHLQHLHPRLDSGGRYTVAARLPAPGRYEVVADFVPDDIGMRELPRCAALPRRYWNCRFVHWPKQKLKLGIQLKSQFPPEANFQREQHTPTRESCHHS